MNVFACAIAFLSALQIDAASAPARVLYNQAAKSIARHETAQATDLLRTLTNNFPDSPVAAVAAVHLAECLAIHDRPAEAYDLLRTWESRIKDSKIAQRIEPQLTDKFSNILTRSAHQRSVALESASDFVGAITWRRLVVDEPSETVDKQRVILRIAVAGCLYKARLGESFEPILEAVEEDSRAAVRFAAAEMLLNNGLENLAARQYEILLNQIKDPGADLRPTWAATVALRRSELLIGDKQYSVAAQLLNDSKAAYVDFGSRHEFDFLLARCAIANIEFDQAKAHLEMVKLDEALDAAARGKAIWLLGELLFLQQDYSGAMSEYSQVLSADCPNWHARALLQMAKCQELSGQVQLAKATYETLHQKHSHSEEAKEALSRISAIQSVLSHR